jgi:hypothetical protein
LIGTEVNPDELSHDALAAELTNHDCQCGGDTWDGRHPALAAAGQLQLRKFRLTEFAGVKRPRLRKGGRLWPAALGGRHWRVAIALLSVRFIQGFIDWGGGSRRFIYRPEKLNPDAPTWIANKFQSAMPGALLGTDHLIAFLLHHFWLLYPAVILFSGAELIAGAALMAWLLTRLAARVSVGFSMMLMRMFGWKGAYLHRRMDAISRCGQPWCSPAAAPIRSTMCCSSAIPAWPTVPGSAGLQHRNLQLLSVRLSRRSTAARSAPRSTTLRSATALCCRMAAARPTHRPTS